MNRMLVGSSGPNQDPLSVRLRRKIGSLLDQLVYGSIGDWLQAAESRYMLEHRPDFHTTRQDNFEFHKLRKGWVRGHFANNGGDFARFYMLYLNIKAVLQQDVPGDFVELGVYKGNSAYMLAHFARSYARTAYLFDTFQGFDERDFRGDDSGRAGQFSDTSLDAVRRHVGDDSVRYVKGFFPESAEAIRMPGSIAVAHIDCDLYDPMKAGLEEFYPRLSPGALLIMHDYASGGWPGATRAIDEFFADKPEKPLLMPDKSGSAVIRRMA